MPSGSIEYISATTNKGQTLVRGAQKTGMTLEKMSSNVNQQILALWGYENANIASIGQVSVNSTCIKGVTSIEASAPTFIDISLTK